MVFSCFSVSNQRLWHHFCYDSDGEFNYSNLKFLRIQLFSNDIFSYFMEIWRESVRSVLFVQARQENESSFILNFISYISDNADKWPDFWEISIIDVWVGLKCTSCGYIFAWIQLCKQCHQKFSQWSIFAKDQIWMFRVDLFLRWINFLIYFRDAKIGR